MKKKMLSLALALALCLGLTIPASARVEGRWIYMGEDSKCSCITIDRWVEESKVQGYVGTEVETMTRYTLEQGSMLETSSPFYADGTLYLYGMELNEAGIYQVNGKEKVLDYGEYVLGPEFEGCWTPYDDVILEILPAGQSKPSATAGFAAYSAYVTASQSPVDSYTDTVYGKMYYDENGKLKIDFDTPYMITVYQFPVGTVLRLTQKAINDNFMFEDSSLSDVGITEHVITNTGGDYIEYLLHSGVDNTMFQIYIQGVAPEFSDVSVNAYYSNAVKWAVEKGITSGTGDGTTFSPNATCTKAQILTFLWRANGSPDPTKTNPFTDIKTTDYFYKAALWAVEKGLVSGSTFGANTDCTRATTMEYMWKAAGSPAPDGKADFADVPANADYAQAVAWAVENEITSGTGGGNFSPAATCTRGQIVTFLYRAMGK